MNDSIRFLICIIHPHYVMNVDSSSFPLEEYSLLALIVVHQHNLTSHQLCIQQQQVKVSTVIFSSNIDLATMAS